MAHRYAQHDLDLIGDLATASSQAPVFLAFADPEMAGAQNNSFGNTAATYMRFQFPPRITSDNRRGKWSSGDLRGKEPVSVFATSGPREMTLSWYYMIDGLVDVANNEGYGVGGYWTSARVQAEVNKIRGYFARIKNESDATFKDASRKKLLVFFKMWRLTGSKPWSCRIESVDVKHSETIVDMTRNADGSSNAYPLRTDISIALRLWTTGTSSGAGDAGPNGATIDIVGLRREPNSTDLWY